jgi:hypothetical protein
MPKQQADQQEALKRIPIEHNRMTLVLHQWIDSQIEDQVPTIAICLALEDALRHLETLQVVDSRLNAVTFAARITT